MTCDAEFTRDQAIDHLEYIKHINDEYSFDTLIEKTSFFKIIYYNESSWEDSTWRPTQELKCLKEKLKALEEEERPHKRTKR